MRLLTILITILCIIASLQNNAEAALCAFRNPDRDTYKLFPQATGYKSVIKIITTKEKKKIEDFLGLPLDYDEGGEHTFYLVLKDEEVIGIIRPHAERGKYGIVEIVWAFTPDGKIIDFIIQRSRERSSDTLKSEKFRKQFRGKSLKDTFTAYGSKGSKIKEGEISSSSIIAYSAKKNLFLYKYFFNKSDNEKSNTAEE